MGITLDDILTLLGDDVLSVIGPAPAGAVDPVSLDADACSGGLSFCNESGEEALARISRSGAAVVICHDRVAGQLAAETLDKAIVAVANPRLAYIRVVDGLAPREIGSGIDATARVHAGAELGDGVHVGPNAVIGADCRIGERSVIDSNVRIYPGTRVGRNVRIFAGAVLGADGFGFERGPGGKLHRFPQRGYVEIEDDVEIGANVCVDRAALDVTRIGAGTKIDNLAYIAHNVQIGRNCLIMASTILAGSVVVGDGVEISPGAVIRDKVTIGDGARIGLGAVVVDDVAAGTTVIGLPAKPIVGDDGAASTR